jgi:hypothetical protein
VVIDQKDVELMSFPQGKVIGNRLGPIYLHAKMVWREESYRKAFVLAALISLQDS